MLVQAVKVNTQQKRNDGFNHALPGVLVLRRVRMPARVMEELPWFASQNQVSPDSMITEKNSNNVFC